MRMNMMNIRSVAVDMLQLLMGMRMAVFSRYRYFMHMIVVVI